MLIPRIVLVLGKGGVGRSSVSAALASEFARRGDRTCIFGWTVSDPIGPWFGLPAARLMPTEIAPRLHVANYCLDDTLKLYFVDHLRLPRFYRHVIHGAHVRKLIEAAPGIAEVFFVGHLWWLTTLAASEAGLQYDRIVVDAPATGHGVSLLDMPAVLASLRATGLVGVETERVVAMMSDRAWTGAVVVALPEELSVEETTELVPNVTRRLGRPPLVAFVNRSVVGRGFEEDRPPWLEPLRGTLSPRARAGVDIALSDLRSRLRFERTLRKALAGGTENGIVSLGEKLMMPGEHRPRDVVLGLQAELRAYLERPT